MNHNRLHIIALGAASLVGLMAVLFPQVDLAISSAFYRPDTGFFLRDHWLAQFAYSGLRYPAVLIVIGLIVTLAVNLRARSAATSARRFAALFLLLVLVCGPGLLVNYVFKDHWGRARPNHTLPFGGDKAFTRALIPADQCKDSCAFVSGHAASGFAFAAVAFLVPEQTMAWLISGVLLGGSIGLARIVQGGHFFSDIVFAFVFVHATAWLLYILLNSWRVRTADGSVDRPGTKRQDDDLSQSL